MTRMYSDTDDRPDLDLNNRPLWWDDTSYIRYQSADSYATEDPYAWMHVASIYSPDYCAAFPGDVHTDECRNASAPVDQPPF